MREGWRQEERETKMYMGVFLVEEKYVAFRSPAFASEKI